MDVNTKAAHILYLSYDGLTDPLGQSQILPYLTALTGYGHRISIISFEKNDRFNAGRHVIEDICKKNNIAWYPLGYTKNPPVLSTLLDLRRLRKKISSLQKQSHFSVVHCRSYITALAGLWMKKKWSVKFIFDMRGFWADERVEGGLWNLKNPLYHFIYRYFKKKEKQFLESADAVITLTYAAKKEIESWPVKLQNEITVIPCCVDLDLFDPEKIKAEDTEQLKKELQIQESTCMITYTGSVGTWYLLDEMLAFFKRWLLHKPDSVFLFVTPDDPGKIWEAARRIGLEESLIRIRPAGRRQMPLMIALSDYCIFFIKPVFSKKASSPTKQAEIMAMGKPLICNSGIGDTDEIVLKYHSGFLVEALADGAYDEAIERVERNQSFDKAAALRGAAEYFSLREGVNRYAGVYEKVLHENTA
jgi:glycosyltransferase involved in cell wall biosynthesis